MIQDGALYELDGEEITACQAGDLDIDAAHDAFELFNHYQEGFLPHSGGIYDQPEILLEIIELVGIVKRERDTETRS